MFESYLSTGVVLLSLAASCKRGGESTHASSTEIATTRGSEGLVLDTGGDLSMWSTDGVRTWRVSTGAPPGEHRLDVAANGNIYTRSAVALTVYNALGVVQWKKDLTAAPAGQFGGVVARPDSSVIFVDSSGQLVCLTTEGAERWRWTPPGPITSAPGVAPDSTIYLFVNEAPIKLGIDGAILWRR